MKANYLCLIALTLISCGGGNDDDEEEPQLQNSHIVRTLGHSFNGSGGLAVDAEGNIYVADFGDQFGGPGGSIVTKITSDGSASLFADGLSGGSGNAFDSQGNLIQANFVGNTLSKIDSEGTITTFATQNLDAPVGVAIDSEGNVFVCNCGSDDIVRITPEGNSSRFASSAFFNCPNGLAIDNEDNLYAANFNSGLVLKISPDGTVESFADVPGGQNGHITFANGRLYVAGRTARQIFELSLTGEITLIAGSGNSGNVDGPALESTFVIPNGIDASPDGSTLYVVSRVNNTLNPVVVRAIDLNE